MGEVLRYFTHAVDKCAADQTSVIVCDTMGMAKHVQVNLAGRNDRKPWTQTTQKM